MTCLCHTALSTAYRLEDKVFRSEVVAVTGVIAYEWRDACEGWVIEHRHRVRYRWNDSEEQDVDSRYASWESKSGTRFRFHSSETWAGQETKYVDGSATRPMPGSGGTGLARFSRPDRADFELANRTLFPSAHNFALIDAALEGTTFFVAPMFDGTEVAGGESVSAVIGRPITDAVAEAPLLSGRHWPVRMAFFAADNIAGEPFYEMQVQLYANGITGGFVMEYRDYSIRFELESLEALPAPAC